MLHTYNHFPRLFFLESSRRFSFFFFLLFFPFFRILSRLCILRDFQKYLNKIILIISYGLLYKLYRLQLQTSSSPV